MTDSHIILAEYFLFSQRSSLTYPHQRDVGYYQVGSLYAEQLEFCSPSCFSVEVVCCYCSMEVSLPIPAKVTTPKGTVIHTCGLQSPCLDSSGTMAVKQQQQKSHFYFPLLQANKGSLSCFQICCQLLGETCFLQTDEKFVWNWHYFNCVSFAYVKP